MVERGFTLEGGFLVTTTPSKVSLAFASPLIPTSLGASHFQLPAAESGLDAAAAAAVFAQAATVDAMGRVMHDGLTSVVDAAVEEGVRAVMRRGLLIAAPCLEQPLCG